MSLCELWIQVRKEQNSTVSRTCGVMHVCSPIAGRFVQPASSGESVSKGTSSFQTASGTKSRSEDEGGILAGMESLSLAGTAEHSQSARPASASHAQQSIVHFSSTGGVCRAMSGAVCISRTSSIRHNWSARFIYRLEWWRPTLFQLFWIVLPCACDAQPVTGSRHRPSVGRIGLMRIKSSRSRGSRRRTRFSGSRGVALGSRLAGCGLRGG